MIRAGLDDAVPETMRAVVLTGFGGYDCLEIRDDVRTPRPAAGEVLIKVAAAAVNNTDINTRIGWYSKSAAEPTGDNADEGVAGAGDDGWSGTPFTFPRIQGADCCGTIVAVGEGVARLRIGERVLVDPLLRDPDGGVRYFGSECDGGFAEFTCVPSANAFRVECGLTDEQLASFPCAFSTAENILTRVGLAPRESVLVAGASGGVGGAAVQLARRRGARVTAIAGADKAEAVRELGAERVVPREANLIAEVGANAFDAVVDVVGGPQFPSLIECLKPGGRYGVSGAIAGPIVELDLRSLYLKDLKLIGCTVLEPQVFANLVRYIEEGEIRALVDRVFPLEEIEQAQRTFLLKRHVGKIVLRVSRD